MILFKRYKYIIFSIARICVYPSVSKCEYMKTVSFFRKKNKMNNIGWEQM